jgi:hypothetical protein
MAHPSPAAKPLPCPVCRKVGSCRAVRADEFDMFLEPAQGGFSKISDRLVPIAKGENKLQFRCTACGTHWRRIKEFEAACAAAGYPVVPVF